jgi:hypothetical protein
MAAVVLGAAGYLWLNRPAGHYQQDTGGLYRRIVNGKAGFMDRAGKMVIQPQFDDAQDFSEGLAAVRVGNRSGYIDKTGKLAITPQFDFAGIFQHQRAAVCLSSGRCGFIDTNGKYLSNPTYEFTGPFSGGGSDAVAPFHADGSPFGYVDRSGKIAIAPAFEGILPGGFAEGLAPVRSGGKWGYIDIKGKWGIEPQFESAAGFSSGLAPVEVGGRTGYIDNRGRFAINPQYDAGREFYEGYAAIRTQGKWGFIDTKGNPAIGAAYPDVGHFSDGLALALTPDGWGYIDRTGKLVVAGQFETADSFLGGLARVTIAGKETYITKAGGYVFDPFPGVTPAQETREVWDESYEGKPSDGKLHLILVRQGTRIRGFDVPVGMGVFIDVAGTAAADGTFALYGSSTWKGKFVSPVLITGVGKIMLASPPGSSKEVPFRLRLLRDATDADFPRPLPATSSDWPTFLESFKAAARQGDSGALTGAMVRLFNGSEPNEHALGSVNLQSLNQVLSNGEEKTEVSPWGGAARSITDRHPCPSCAFEITATFTLDPENHWRWTGFRSHAPNAAAGSAASPAPSVSAPAPPTLSASRPSPQAPRQNIGEALRDAQTKFSKREYKSALAACDQALRLEPGSAEANRLHAQIKETMSVLGIQ